MSVGRITPEQVSGTRQLLADRQHAYRLVFSDAHGKLVREDLERFARYGLTFSAFYPDQREDDMYAGRQDMAKRILQYLELPLDDLLRLRSPEVYAAMMAGAPPEEDEDA